MKRFTIPASIAVVSAFCALPALADVPPPEGYVESCTVEKKVSETTECLACAAYYGATTRCQTMLEPYCYSSVCKTRGASAWGEVFCRTKNASAPVVPQEITSVLPTATSPSPSVAKPGSCPSPSTGTSTGTGSGTGTSAETSTGTGAGTSTATVTPTGTATQATTEPSPEKKDDSGCSLGTGNALRTLGPWSIALVGLLLASLRRRRR